MSVCEDKTKGTGNDHALNKRALSFEWKSCTGTVLANKQVTTFRRNAEVVQAEYNKQIQLRGDPLYQSYC